ncbi:MAG: hypothetical protein K6A40_01960 [Solobacterium sp.]|nr:hypothetical protein [Solobacterium sp.]
MTDLYNCLYDTMRNPRNIHDTDVAGSIVYYNMQAFNKVFLNYSIVLLVIAAFLFITNTHSRRKYYIGNYAAIGVFAAASIYLTVFAHIYIQAFRAQWLKVDFAALKAHSEMWGTYYTESTFWFDVHYFVFALLLIVAGLLVWNAVWKYRLMKEENQLIEDGRRVLE